MRTRPPEPAPPTESEIKADLDDLARTAGEAAKLVIAEVEGRRAGARTVQQAAAGIAALYTGVLGLVFSVTDNPLPVRGVLTPFFLGLAIVFATTYLAWVPPTDHTPELPTTGTDLQANVRERLRWLASLAARRTRTGSSSVRVAVVALGFGLLCIALPFVSLPGHLEPGSDEPWPPATVAPGESEALAELRYARELEEAVRERADVVVPDLAFEVRLVAGAAALGLSLMALAALLDRPREPDKT
ncbi:hypothetical protein GXB85_05840 [Cellulomonas sp. APG4]|uniref:hypothetical protein n=1 Tax=Cellulomonas sp. APG4 TaxID=1538656 RepID=UPI00137B0FED|nr:hypothetical protein [Cellulomonas sp. APG4]NCT90469.1 hypothetical protein [Cellulomonas sp. APG4]